MKTSIYFFVISLAAIAFSSCNTMIGIGRDTRILGEQMEKTAEKSAAANSSSNYDTGGAPVY